MTDDAASDRLLQLLSDGREHGQREVLEARWRADQRHEETMTKQEKILALLSDHEAHHMRELLEVGGFRYGARLKELRDAGHDIRSIHVQGSEWRFQLVSAARQLALI